MSANRGPLAQRLHAGIVQKRLSVEDLAERTTVPRATIASLLDEPVSAVLPERVYLRGHMLVLVRELDIAQEEALRLFDARYPEAPKTEDLVAQRRFGTGSVALAAGLAGIAVLAVVLAFASALS